MEHYSYEQWKKYIQDEVEEEVRERYENHLYRCDHCLEVYMEALDFAGDSTFPIMEQNAEFTDKVMDRIMDLHAVPIKPSGEDKKRRFYQHVLFQYLLAAAVTLIFMSTGIFQSIIQYTEKIQRPSFQENRAELTNGIMDKTFAWRDSQQEDRKKGEGKE